jgi:TonB family protein
MLQAVLRIASFALLPLPSDTPPVLRVPPPPPRELRAVDDVVLTARMPDGTRVPSTIVLPQIRNRRDIINFIRSNYPDTIRRSAPTIMPVAWVYIDETGRTHLPRLIVTTGSADFDSVALAAVRRAWFEPAKLNSAIVPLWVMLPVQLSPNALSQRDAPRPGPNAPSFTPYDRKPELKNRADVQRALVQFYPRDLRALGLGGTTLVWVYLNEKGEVSNVQVRESSGFPNLDEAAVRVAEMMLFTPAENKGREVPVWISLPIVFKTR